jgi:hypothetical protein
LHTCMQMMSASSWANQAASEPYFKLTLRTVGTCNRRGKLTSPRPRVSTHSRGCQQQQHSPGC